ncbi:hypothetical protein M404DRAFT_146915 [Pisolithus tinctorius Marx 270]|uniref:Uncharacterized protein n=1 Tax=Pisolithus tinctorius Marx 270 TaxID=870435 RepID=A0A0C3K010_PISTI|nr:hypothetical protein M404DRAFT_146915 [Pisolithus tinctorius Marx 270]
MLASGSSGHRGLKKQRKELDPAMDCLIIAGSQGVMCQQVMIVTCFDNSNTGNKEYSHVACDPDCSDGCVWCVPTKPHVCCDLHNPSAFIFVDVLPPSPPRNPAHSHLSKYSMETRELALCDALEDWREGKVIVKLGVAHVNDYGPGFILLSPMIDHIIDSVHHLKLWTINDLWRETCWSGVGLYGAEVLAIVHQIIPQLHDGPLLMRMPIVPHAALQP